MEKTGRRSAWTGDIAVEGAATRASPRMQQAARASNEGSRELESQDARSEMASGPASQPNNRTQQLLFGDRRRAGDARRREGKLSALLRTARLQ